MPAARITATLVAGKTRPPVEEFCSLLEALWEEELVTPSAVVSAGPLQAQEQVQGATAVGSGRQVRWEGADLAGLLAAVRAAYAEDVSVWFPTMDLEAFESPEEDEDEEDEEEGERPEVAGDLSLGEFEIEAPSLCLHSARAPVAPKDTTSKAPAGAAWATLDGGDVGLLVDDLGDCWLRDVLEEFLGKVKIGKIKR